MFVGGTLAAGFVRLFLARTAARNWSAFSRRSAGRRPRNPSMQASYTRGQVVPAVLIAMAVVTARDGGLPPLLRGEISSRSSLRTSRRRRRSPSMLGIDARILWAMPRSSLRCASLRTEPCSRRFPEVSRSLNVAPPMFLADHCQAGAYWSFGAILAHSWTRRGLFVGCRHRHPSCALPRERSNPAPAGFELG